MVSPVEKVHRKVIEDGDPWEAAGATSLLGDGASRAGAGAGAASQRSTPRVSTPTALVRPLRFPEWAKRSSPTIWPGLEPLVTDRSMPSEFMAGW
jgi:hypothetical protein